MRNAAVICRYGHQSFFELSGRDPILEPMTYTEQAIFARCLMELWTKEVEVAPPDLRPSND